VVRRLIENEHVGFVEQECGKPKPRLLTAAELSDRRLEVHCTESKSLQDRLAARPAAVAAERLEALERCVIGGEITAAVGEGVRRVLQRALCGCEVPLRVGDDLLDRPI
jgi:hypothetical protein